MYPGEAAWHFLTLPTEVSDEITDLTGGERRGFGSVRVEVTIGGSTWQTSLFPDKSAGSYVLPLKKAIRRAEGIGEGDTADVSLELAG